MSATSAFECDGQGPACYFREDGSRCWPTADELLLRPSAARAADIAALGVERSAVNFGANDVQARGTEAQLCFRELAGLNPAGEHSPKGIVTEKLRPKLAGAAHNGPLPGTQVNSNLSKCEMREIGRGVVEIFEVFNIFQRLTMWCA